MSTKRDADVVAFAANRLVEVYGENPNVDFIHALRRVEARLRQEDEREDEGDRLSVHPFTCGTCKWEGETRRDYFEHIVRERHDHWESVLDAVP